jgi:hypothetical protein
VFGRTASRQRPRGSMNVVSIPSRGSSRVSSRHDVVSGPREREDREGDGGHPAPDDEPGLGAFQRGDLRADEPMVLRIAIPPVYDFPARLRQRVERGAGDQG